MRLRLEALVLVAFGCASSGRQPATPASGVAARENGLTFDVRAPKSAPYDAASLGAGAGRTVSLRVANASDQPVSIAGLEITFSAKREGVAFACAERGENIANERLPATIGPHGSVEIDRTIACATPLPGAYDVDVFARAAPGAERRKIGHVAFELVAGARTPQPLGPAGLYATLLGARRTPPLTERAWNEGDYHVVLALINGSARSIPLGPASLAFVVFKKGSPYPCKSEAKPLELPAELRSGSVYTKQLPISCAPSEEGAYEVSGRLRMGDTDEVEIGRFGLRVTRDPLLFTPLPPY